MSWEESDLLGNLEEDRPHEYFYEDFIGDENSEEYYDEEDEEDEEMPDDYLSIDDIDFSSLDGKNLRKDFKKLNTAVTGKRVVRRQPNRRKKLIRPTKPNLLKATPKSLIKKAETPKRIVQQSLIKKPTKVISKKETPKVASKPTPKVASKPTPKVASKPTPKVASKPTPKVASKPKLEVGKKPEIPSRFGKKTTQRILVPQDRKVIVEGVDKFILSNSKESEAIRNIGYYKGEKLKELVLIINNQTPNDFTFELFNPSMPLDYLFSSGQNLNNRISVAGDNKVQYSDMLFNLLANPTILPNAKFVCENPVNPNQAYDQFNQPLIFKNKNIAGYEKIHPIQNALNTDIDQNQNNIVYWDILGTLGRAFIPDGMDVISYKVLAGNIVTFGFYYKQVSLKRFFFKEARDKKIL